MFDGLVEWRKSCLAVYQARHFATTAFQKGLYGNHPQAAGQDPIHTGRATAPLDVPQNGYPHVVMRETAFDTFGDRKGTARVISFGHDNHPRCFILTGTVEPVHHGLIINLNLRDKDAFRADTDSPPQRDETGVAAHYLHNEDPVVRFGGVADFVYGI